MNILITGGNGYIGKYLVDYFKDEKVFITTRNPINKNERKMDLEDESTIRGVCRGIDVVIHTATMDERKISQYPKETLLVNAYGTRQLYLDAVENDVKKFIYLSTFHVYGDVEKEITEYSPTFPKTDYGVTHLFAEQYLQQLYAKHKLPTAILRLTNGVGLPGDSVDKWYLVLNDFCRTIVKEKKIKLKSNGLPRRDFVAISDICTAIDLLKDTNFQLETYNISSEQTYSIRELAYMVKEKYFEMTGCDTQLDLPRVTEEEIKQTIDFCVNSHKLRAYGWTPKETMEETIISILANEMKRGDEH